MCFPDYEYSLSAIKPPFKTENVDYGRRLYIGNISWSHTVSTFQEKVLKDLPGILDVYFPKNKLRDGREHNGYCFIGFDTDENALTAVRALSGADDGFGRKLFVRPAKIRA